MIKKLEFNKETVAGNLRAYRARKNVSRVKAAAKIGLDPASLKGYESAKHAPTLKNAVALANYYGVTVEDLLEG